MGIMGINDPKHTFKIVLKHLQDDKILENCDISFMKAAKEKLED